MKLILPRHLANELIDHLKFDEVDTLVQDILSEYYFVNINFSQKSYYIAPTFSKPTLEDFIFADMILDIS